MPLKKQCKTNENEYNLYISENCFYCDKELTKTKDIFIDIEFDRYVCKSCAKRHNLSVVECMEY
ncbi:MAG: hypothetical protein A2086_14190 [Spirochaetes bacterium GWD1_27_9]|nr:MAG: hypothetical protein A2Y34_05495 [Spirochaetes bacterium GWC1_27_15]OHD35460.1 MAG: hypothetical protein A2086_14190 [Spirochaetes bacterium GWD1_27_9]